MSRNWILEAKTIDEQIRRRALVKRNAAKHRQLLRATYSIYRQLLGEYRKPSLPALPARNCLICGIGLTGKRRTMCGSRSCHAAREAISRRLIAEGKKPTSRKSKRWVKLRTQSCAICGTQTYSRTGICAKSALCLRANQNERKQLIADNNWTGGNRFHPIRHRQCIVCGNTLYLPRIRYCQTCKRLRRVTKRHQKRSSQSSRQRTLNFRMAYTAMRELNLLPKENES